MKCQGCGAELFDGQLFCPYCGARNEQVPVQPAGTQNTPAPDQIPIYQMNQNQENQKQNQTSPYPMPPQTGQMPPRSGQIPPQSGQVPSQPGQVPPYPMQGQVPPAPGAVPPYPMQGQVPPAPGAVPPYPMQGQMPPYQAAYPQPKKKSFIPVIIIVGVLVVLLMGAIASVVIIGKITRDKGKTVYDKGKDILNELKEEFPKVFETPDDSDDDITSADEDIPSFDDDTTGSSDNNDYSFTYNYYELPGVASIDGDPRFVYYDYSPDSFGITVYTYYFNNTLGTDAEYRIALQEYCAILKDVYYCEHEMEITQWLDDGTHAFCEYYSLGNTIIGITANSDRYVYISIFDRSYIESDDSNSFSGNDSYSDGDMNIDGDYPTYYEYLYGREEIAFTQYNLVMMENGINFYMNDIYLNDNGDGTATIDCAMDLQTNFISSDLYSDDFMVIPMDANGDVIGDATKINSVTDSYGNSLSTPVVLTADYVRYNLSFIVPSDTVYLFFIGTNIQLDSSSDTGASPAGPMYYIKMTFSY